MTNNIRVVHYLNQFFAQIGGEDKADVGPQVKATARSARAARCSKPSASTAKSSRRFFAATIFLPSSKNRRSIN